MPRHLAGPESIDAFLPAEIIPPARSEMEARRTNRIHGVGLPFHVGTWPVRLALRLVLLVGQRVDAASPGEVVAWGASSDGQTSVPRDARSGVVTVAAGFSHPVTLRSEGSSRRRSISYGHVPLLDRTRLLPARSMAPAPRPSRCRCGSPSYRPRICRRWWRWSHRPGRPSKNSFSRRLHPGSPRRCRWNPGRSSTGSANGRRLPPSGRCAGWIDPAGRCGRHGDPAVQDREGTPSRPVARPAQPAFASGHGRFVSFVPFYEDRIGAATAPRPSIGARVSPTTAGTRPRSRRHLRPGRT